MNLKKPNFWDKKEPNFFSYILIPITIFFKIIVSLKPKSKIKIKDIKTICVGNIYLGGTGKTSLAIKIKEILTKKNIKTCFVKKFYTNQFDEQKLLKNYGKLFVANKRIDALNQAAKENYAVAILDDGLQDYSINYDISLVCFNTINWIGNGMTIPSGPLRESLNVLKNYNNIFLNGVNEDTLEIEKKALKINPNINIHKSKYIPKNLNEFNINNNYLVFSGIGNHKTFISMLKEHRFKIIKDLEFSDHYNFTDRDLDKIINLAETLNCKVVTTEKDYYRLDEKYHENIKFIKSELKLDDEEKLVKILLN
jgi:tetraacyldisaccharide 4'-kinase